MGAVTELQGSLPDICCDGAEGAPGSFQTTDIRLLDALANQREALWPLNFRTRRLVLSTTELARDLRRFNRLYVWAMSHLLMAAGVWLPSIWPTLTSIAIAALLVGGTFMVVTMIGMQEARARAEENTTVVLAQMTAGFALGHWTINGSGRLRRVWTVNRR